MQQDAAILIPVFRTADGELHLVLVRRSNEGMHGGQLAFPGGKRDPGDRSMWDTALREAREEIGVGRDQMVLLAELPAVHAKTTAFRVFPFLVRLLTPGPWQHDTSEIAEIIDVLLRDLMRPDTQGYTVQHFPTWSAPQNVPCFWIGPYCLWGLSYRILQPLLPRVLAGEWAV
jgi:8-oxo-dGTP pyrophosphatase MutT (NUDIX family)